MKKILTLAVIALLCTGTACASKTPELKSPCVGLDDSPCGTKRKINDWWMHA